MTSAFRVLTFLLTFVELTAFALSKDEKKILNQIQWNQITEDAKKCSEFSDEWQALGRASILAGTVSEQKFVLWLKDRLQKADSPEIKTDEISVPSLVAEKTSVFLKVGDQEIPALMLLGSAAGSVTQPLAFLGNGTIEDIKKAGDVTGKILLMERDDFLTGSLGVLIAEAETLGAKGLILYGTDGGHTPADLIRQERQRAELPVLLISSQQGKELRLLAEKGTRASLEVKYKTKNLDASILDIEVKDLPPSASPSAPIVFSANLDRWFSGAVDHCTGIGAALELVRLLSSKTMAHGHPVQFLFWSGIETGFPSEDELLGKAALFQYKYFSNNPAPLHVFVLSNLGEPGNERFIAGSPNIRQVMRKTLTEFPGRTAKLDPLSHHVRDEWGVLNLLGLSNSQFGWEPSDFKWHSSKDDFSRVSFANLQKDFSAMLTLFMRIDRNEQAALDFTELLDEYRHALQSLKGIVDKDRIEFLNKQAEKLKAQHATKHFGANDIQSFQRELYEIGSDLTGAQVRARLVHSAHDLPLLIQLYNQVQRSRWKDAERTLKKLNGFRWADSLDTKIFVEAHRRLADEVEGSFPKRYVRNVDTKLWTLFMGGRKNISSLLKLIEKETDNVEDRIAKDLDAIEAVLKKIQGT